MNQPPFKSMLLDNNRGTNMIDGRYFAELSDSDEGAAVHYDNEVIEASSDQEAIGKAGAWAASHRLGVVATLIVKQGLRGGPQQENLSGCLSKEEGLPLVRALTMLIKLNDRGVRVYMATAKYRARPDWKSRTGTIAKYSRDRSVADVVWNGTRSFDRVSVDLIEAAQ